MQIVIDIDDERYKDIQRIASAQLDMARFQTAEQIIANGIPLPKGHGRLIDADERRTEIDEEVRWVVDLAETIIKADKAGEEE